MRTRLFSLLLALTVSLPFLTFQLAGAQRRSARRSSSTSIPTPQEVLGFNPGDDRRLASWNQVLTYFEKLDQASDRVKFEALGKTTMDVPFVMATISAPENLARLDEYRDIQGQLADPRKLGPPRTRDRKAAELIRRGKAILLITCGIHSTEVGSYLSSMLIAHRLASSNEPEIHDILKNTIILLVPSLNPDGVDIVKKWYDKTLGTQYEGTNPPELYQKYVGHDNNRDWYAFTQVETKIAVTKIHNVWHPQIVHDIHQQGEFGSRLFLPPYMPPVEPNVPKQLVEGYTELGNWMAAEMRRSGFKGITTNSTYDAWTPARAYSHYHGGVRILSETASVHIATPVTLKFEELRSREGYDPQKESDKYGPLWRGGDWRLRDITNYMTAGAFSLLRHASQNREQWLRRFYDIGRDAVRARPDGTLQGFQIHPGPNAARLVRTLEAAQVETEFVRNAQSRRSRNSENAEAVVFVPLAQPYGGFAKALLERQSYPDLRDKEGHPIAPYDVTAHSLALLMNVEVDPVYRRARPNEVMNRKRYDSTAAPDKAAPKSRIGLYRSHVPAMDEGWTRWALEQEHFPYHSIFDKEIRSGGLGRYGAIVIPDQIPRTILNGHRLGIMPPEYSGGLGTEGVAALRNFVEQGGTLVCLNRASDFAIEQFKLPVRDVVDGTSEKEFFVPGSILSIELDKSSPLTEGMPTESIAWVEDSPVFEIVGGSEFAPGQKVQVIATYPVNRNPLLSGWLLGADRLKGKAALVEVQLGKGRIILFGFRPQYRGQSLATYPLFFNALR
jgi:Zinc carboxypeptidase